MIEEKEIIIDGQTFRIQQLPARKGVKIFLTVSKILASCAGSLNKENIMKSNVESLASHIFDNLDDEKTSEMVCNMVSSSIVFPLNLNFDLYFAGKYDSLFKIVFEILKFNYGNLFDFLKKKVPGDLSKEQTKQEVK
jgi:transcriptional regulator NrdR family protein